MAGPARGAAAHGVAARDDLELLERLARALGDAGERRVGDVGRHLRLLVQALLEAVQQRAAARQQDAGGEDVGGELGRRAVERVAHRVDDRLDRLGERLARLLGRHRHRLGQAGHELAAAQLGGQLRPDAARRRRSRA